MANDVADEADREVLKEAPPPVAIHREHLKNIVESLLFVSQVPLSLRELAKSLQADVDRTGEVLAELQRDYQGRGIELAEVGGGFQFRTATASAPFVRDHTAQKPTKLSRAQLETLAIVAYRQPITRPEIDEVRGVDSGAALKLLGDRELIRILGRKEEPGRPLLYGTTIQFLNFFGLTHLKDLPTLREFSELSEESRALFERKLGEPLDLHFAAADVNRPADDGDSAVGEDDSEASESTAVFRAEDLEKVAEENRDDPDTEEHTEVADITGVAGGAADAQGPDDDEDEADGHTSVFDRSTLEITPNVSADPEDDLSP